MADKKKSKVKPVAKKATPKKISAKKQPLPAKKKALAAAPAKKIASAKKPVPAKKEIVSKKKSAAAKPVSSAKKKPAAVPAIKPVSAKRPASAKKSVPAAKKSAPAKKEPAAKKKPVAAKPVSSAKKKSAAVPAKKNVPAPKKKAEKTAPAKAEPAVPAAPKKAEVGTVKYAPDRSDVLTHAERERRRKSTDNTAVLERSQKMPHAEGDASREPVDQVLMNEKVRELDQLSKQQGFVTIEDINRLIPETGSSHEAFESIINILDNLDVKILDNDEVDAYKLRLSAEEENALRMAQVDILDDPVRMYLRQMGQVPLLSREQEIQISRRIEEAESRAQDALCSVWLTLPVQLDTARRLNEKTERFDRVVLDKKVESREWYFRMLPKAISAVEAISAKLDKAWAEHVGGANEEIRRKGYARFVKPV